MWRRIALAALLLSAAMHSFAAPLPDELLLTVRNVGAVDVIVELDASAIDRSAATRRARLPRRIDDDAALASLAGRYRRLKDQTMRPLQGPDIDERLDYSHLPMRAMHVRSEAALRALAVAPGVRALYPDVEHRTVLAESLPQTGQPAVAAAGYGGNGATVAVIDNGIDRNQTAFGGCTAVGVPASCRVVVEQTFATAPATDSRHGTNVAAIVAGVAPQARIAALNVFEDTGGAYTSSILSAINWAIANRSAYGIVAINMSLGDTSRNAAQCTSSSYTTPIANARAAGIHVVVSAGNAGYVNGAFSAGLASPACTPGAVSVGAVYDANVGGLIWGSSPNQCTDNTSRADQITCFSMSSTYLSLLAPGALISAGGFALGGTSQAAPHVAGALAVLRSAFAGETLAAAESRLTANGTPIFDSRINRSFPRLNLAAAARPANDDFAAATVLSGTSGSAGGSNRLATLQSGEPVPAGSGGSSVWWTWTAAAAGQVSLSTAGSSFDTRLDVYTGAAVSGLSAVAANDNAGTGTTSSSLRFQAAAGLTYRIAVSGVGGASGNVALGWSLNTAAQANLSVALTGPGSALPGSVVVYTLIVANAGPQSATGVVATVSLPAGLSVDSIAEGCVAQPGSVVCSVGELAAAAQTQFSIALLVDSLTGPVSLSASLDADLPDPVTGDNTTSTPLDPAASGEGDIPTLPEWALLLLGGWLLARIAAGDRQKHARAHRS